MSRVPIKNYLMCEFFLRVVFCECFVMRLVCIKNCDLKEETGNNNHKYTRFAYDISSPAVKAVCISRLS